MGFTTSFDSLGAVNWTRSDPVRSAYSCNGAAILSDGQLAICGVTQPSGIFIDDFFLRDFEQIETTYYGAFVATFPVNASTKPIFRLQPRNQRFAIRGENVTLHSQVYSALAVTFQWFKNGVLIPGQSGSDLLLPNVQSADSASYYVEARNASGITRSTAVDVVVNSVSVSVVAGTDQSGAFTSPRGMVVLPDGSILVSDSAQHQIKRVTTSGVTTFAGMGEAGFADGSANEAKFKNPTGLAFEYRYYGPIVYVADSGNSFLRKIFLSADMASVSRVDSVSTGFDAPSAAATLDGLPFVFLGSSGSNTLWRFFDGVMQTLAPANGSGAISGIVADARSNVYVSDSVLNEIRRTSAAFETQSIAQGLDAPAGLALDADDNLYVAERGAQTIRKISASGAKTLVAGGNGASGFQNGTGAQALFNAPDGICFRNGSLLVADTGNHCLREVKFIPLNSSNPGDAQLQITFGGALSIAVSGGASTTFIIESTAQLGANAQWQTEGTVSANSGQGLSLSKPAGTRFYRAQQSP
jgi:hypothetical protein